MFRSINLPSGITRVGVFGQPYHGLATASAGNAVVSLPGGLTKNLGRPLSSGDTRLTQRPGWSTVSRTGADAARDVANGWSWPNYFIFGGFFSITGWVFIDSGVPWQVYTAWDGSDYKLYYRRFGLFGLGSSNTWSSLVITGDTDGLGTFQNHTPTGDKAAWLGFLDDDPAIHELTITGSSGAGPSAAALVKTNPLLDDSWTYSTTDADTYLCSDTTTGSTWVSVDAEFTNECVVKIDYISGTMTKWILRIHSVMAASGSDSCSYDDDTNACSYTRTESMIWTHEYWIRQDSGAETKIVDIVFERTFDMSFDRPATTGDEHDEYTINDSVTVNGNTWTGTYGWENINVVRGSGPFSPAHSARPTYTDGFGLGTYKIVWDRDPPGGQVSASTVYPYFYISAGEPLDIINLYVPSTAYRTETGAGNWADGVCANDDYGMFSVGFMHQTNNVSTVRNTLMPETFDWTTSAITTWGPCMATGATSATIMTADNHWASYHPVTKTLARSTTAHLCWL